MNPTRLPKSACGPKPSAEGSYGGQVPSGAQDFETTDGRR